MKRATSRDALRTWLESDCANGDHKGWCAEFFKRRAATCNRANFGVDLTATFGAAK